VSHCFVHMWKEITGESCPPCPISVHNQNDYPWFGIYDEGKDGIDNDNRVLSNVVGVQPVCDGDWFTKELDEQFSSFFHKVTLNRTLLSQLKNCLDMCT